MESSAIEKLITDISKLPGLGRRSAQRIALYLLKNKDYSLLPLIQTLKHSHEKIIECKILSSCPKKGCWMEVKFETDTVFVKFKDYGFFVPKNGIEGKKAIINGILSTETVSVKELQHYAEDAGKSELEISKINKPEIKFSFLADGLLSLIHI